MTEESDDKIEVGFAIETRGDVIKEDEVKSEFDSWRVLDGSMWLDVRDNIINPAEKNFESDI